MDTWGRSCTRSTWIMIAIMLSLPVVTSSYKVLFMIPFVSRSHKNVFDPIAKELGKRGHQVTIFSPFEEKSDPEGVHNVWMSSAKKLQDRLGQFSFFNSQLGKVYTLEAMKMIHNSMCQVLNESYSDPFVQNLIKNPRVVTVNGSTSSIPRYDVVVLNGLFNEFNLPLAHHLGVPFIYVEPSLMPATVAWALNVPCPPYVPNGLMPIADKAMSFWQRLFTMATNIFVILMRSKIQFPLLDDEVRRYLPDGPAIGDIEKNVSFLMTNSHFSINPSSPSMPYHADIGGVQCKPAQKLDKNLEDFMQSSGEDGVIYFSLGSVQRGEDMPDIMRESFLSVFNELPQKILWKYEKHIKDLPSNIKLTEWAPQQDVLGHPKVRLFISHGGGLSIQETSYHGKPVLAFPLGAEQLGNVGNAVRLGFGEYLDWRTFTAQDLRRKIERLLRDPKYTDNARTVSRVVRDRPERPAELAAYWVEYVVRHNGAHHLKSGAENLNFFQYFLLDVITVIIIVVTTVVVATSFLALLIIRKCINFLSRGKSRNYPKNARQSKQKTNNKGKIKKS